MTKKWISVLLSLLLVTGLSACKSRTPVESDDAVGDEYVLPDLDDEDASLPDWDDEEESGSEEEEEEDTEGAEQAARELLLAIQSGSAEQIRSRIDYKNLLQLEEGQTDESLLQVAARLQFEILDSAVDGKTAEVTAQLTNVDMHKMLPDYLQKAMEMEYTNALAEEPLAVEAMELEYAKVFSDMLDEGKNAGNVLSKTVDLQLVDGADGWRVQPTDDLRTGAFGDYFAARKQVGLNAGGGQR